METQQLEEILRKYEDWNTHGRPTTRKIRRIKESKEYCLVATNSQEFYNPDGNKPHYHYGTELYLIFKPKLITKQISWIDNMDFPLPPEEIYTELEIEEQKKQVIVKYLKTSPASKEYNLEERKEQRIEKFRWVTSRNQGERKCEYKIEKARD